MSIPTAAAWPGSNPGPRRSAALHATNHRKSALFQRLFSVNSTTLLLGDKFLIDIGSGSHDRIAAMKIPYDSLNKVFIGHLHVDHYIGTGRVAAAELETHLVVCTAQAVMMNLPLDTPDAYCWCS